ncbi:MAG: MFS transporter [Alphaproteobacteria bacterium]|jgi:MFS family permease|nr:MFS transporter [Alphaproteobacteria bacterium]MDP6254064.1 MFS transporter [Alphaproteobacteria bacterium]MDP7052805.1 MFS transporter [Alphaproteobacteria bacterium]MDP7227026.1 MFS transporter [Alphaproteobacteria bacterium]MDP7461806.1 MFS transporter [Alphaproteobacteria bacterium]
MDRDRTYFFLLNIGHFMDHLFTLVFATVAALVLYREWGVGYAELIAYATPGFFAFGVFSLPAGWIADKWTRDGMMCVFFIGIGLTSIATGFTETPLQIGIGLFVIGMFAAIYHPVGLAIVTTKWRNTGMRIAANGVWGNLGVASAALIAGYLIDHGGWRMAFIIPGCFSILVGFFYMALRWDGIHAERNATIVPNAGNAAPPSASYRALLLRVSIIVFFTTAVSSVIFQATTFALPKIFDERLQGLAAELSAWMENFAWAGQGDVATVIGSLAFIVFAVASIAQLVVGSMLDRFGPRHVFMVVSTIQLIFFMAMPGLRDGMALAVALCFMLGAFGQIPINDYMIGKTASGAYRARIYGVRYVVSFTALATSLPFIAFVYQTWGFDTLFRILAGAAIVIFCAVTILPRNLPTPEAAPEAAD